MIIIKTSRNVYKIGEFFIILPLHFFQMDWYLQYFFNKVHAIPLFLQIFFVQILSDLTHSLTKNFQIFIHNY